jgi:hypothetical protein
MRQMKSPLVPKNVSSPKFHALPSRSNSGCAENGAATRSGRQVTGPRVSTLAGSISMALPASQSASTRPPMRTTAVFAVLKSSLLREGMGLSMCVPAARTSKRPARCSCVNLDVATMRATCDTPPSSTCQARTRPSPSNQC